MEIFAKRLRELRLLRGLSVKNLAEKLDISDMTIFRWENAIADIKCENLVLLANFFGVSADYLLGLDDYY